MAKNKEKKGKNEPDVLLPTINISDNKWQYIPPNFANLECQDFNCSGNFLTTLAFVPKKINGNLICRNNKKITGESNPLNRFHLGAGRFDLFNGPESSETNRPVLVGGSLITDLGVYKDPKIYDCTVETSAAPEKQLTAREQSKKTVLKQNPKQADIDQWLAKIFVSSERNMLHRVKDMMVSLEGVKQITSYEGIEFTVYDDYTGKPISSYSEVHPDGNATIGIGHLIRSSERDKYSRYLLGKERMSLRDVWILKVEDLTGILEAIRDKYTNNAMATQGMFDAISSWAFNTGPNKEYRKVDGKPGPLAAIKKINVGDYKTAGEYLRTYNVRIQTNLNGRRTKEYQMFIKDGNVK